MLCGMGLLVLDVRRLMILYISEKIITTIFFSRRGVVYLMWVVAGSRDVRWKITRVFSPRF